jgi:hypothetical protein
MASVPREDNRVPGLVAKSDSDNTPIILEADPVTKRLKVSAIITSGGSGGGGTQYTDGTTQATPTGTVALGYDGTSVRALKTAADGTLKTQLDAAQANTTGTITTSTGTVTATDLMGIGAVTVMISGTYAGLNVIFETSIDGGINWIGIPAQPLGTVVPNPIINTGVLTANSTNAWNVSPLLGVNQFRVRATAYTSGTANVVIAPSAQFTQYLSNTVGNDIQVTGSVASNGTTFAQLTLNGQNTFTFSVSGTFSASFVLQFSADGVNFANLTSNASLYNALSGTTVVPSISTTGLTYRINIAGYAALRFITTSYSSGTINVTGNASYATPTAIDGIVQTSQQGSITVLPVTQFNSGNITTSSTVITGGSLSSLSGLAAVVIQGTYAGISFIISNSNDNSTYANCRVYDAQTNVWLPAGTTLSPTNNSTSTYWVPVYPTSSSVRVTSTAYTSGTGAIRIHNGVSGSPGHIMTQDNSTGLTGTTVPTSATYVGLNNAAGNLSGLRGLSNNSDGVNTTAGGNVLDVWAEQVVYNGANFDRARNNTSVVVVAAGATSGSTTTITTYNARELVLVVNVSAFTSGTINLAVNGVSISSYTYPLLSAITGLTATGTSTYRIGVGLTPAAGLVANDVLPRSVQVVVSGTFVATFGIDAVLGL